VSDVADADLISVTVLNDEQVRDVVGELAAHAKPGTVVAIHSTISDTTAVELSQQLKERGIHIVDAPVSGGAGAAAKGELATMVGAERSVYERIKPAFKQWASMVVHAGEPGAGTRMKLARNMLTFTSYAAACEAMRLAAAAGLDLQALGRVVRHTDALTGGPGAIMVRDDMNSLEPENFLYQSFSHARDLGEKDLSLALALGQAISVDLPLAEIARERLASGLGVPHRAPSN
jgi:3-hydroxyisobutyrate dehydrogenase-like beta-hydroxyacid dehydrogenase